MKAISSPQTARTMAAKFGALPRARRPLTKLAMARMASTLFYAAPPFIAEYFRQGDHRPMAAGEFQKKLRGDDYVFDFAANTLQRRLLTYFEKHLGFKECQSKLVTADKRRREMHAVLEREALLGLHPGNTKLLPLVEALSDFEIYVLNSAVNADDRSESFSNSEVVEIISRELLSGRRADVITYIAKRLEHQTKRVKPGKAVVWREVFHPAKTIAVWLWTHPDIPLWMMPSAGAVNVINGFLKEFKEKQITQNNFDTLVRQACIPRVPTAVVSDFISVKLKDSAGLALREELEKVMGIRVASMQRGAKRKVPRG